MNENNTARFAIYLRLSTKPQMKGYGLRHQEAEALNLLKNAGVQEFQKFTDSGFRGATLERPALDALRKAVGRGEIKLLAVYSLCRLSRSEAGIRELLVEFRTHGLRLLSCEEKLDTASSYLEQFLSVAAYSVNCGTKHRTNRTIAAKKDLAKRCIFVGGKPPYALTPKENSFVIDEEKAQHILKIFKYVDAGHEDQEIAGKLNCQNILSPEGIDWQEDTIKKIRLNRNKYRGLFVHKIDGEAYMHFESSLAILKDSTWENLCQKYAEITHETGKAGCNGKCLKISQRISVKTPRFLKRAWKLRN